jgi:hypothetical protein
MKRIATLLLFIISLVASSQQQFFVGKDSDLLIGKSVTIKEGQSAYNEFYKNPGLTKILFKKGNGSDPDKLKGQIFEVKGSMKHPKSYVSDIVLILENKEQGIVYYSYNPKYSDMFLLNVVGGFTPPDNFLCTRLITEKDNFSSKLTTNTPIEYEYSITKVEENGDTRIYLTLQSYGPTLNINKKGLKILFSDGTVLVKPDVKIDYKIESGLRGYTYSCFLKLEKEDIVAFTNKTITDYSLYIYERKFKNSNAFDLKEYLKCLTK